MVTIYRFKVYCPHDDAYILSQRWGTKEAIDKVRGLAIDGTGVEADDKVVLNPMPDMMGLTAKGFDPSPREHGGDGG